MVRRVRADRKRQSMAIHNRHDFHAFSALRSSDFQPATLGHNEGCIDEAFFFVQCASIAKLVGNIRQHATQNLIAANDSAQGRAVGTHPGSFSRGEYCRWTQWHMLPQTYPNYKTVHRRFQTWCRDEVLRRVLTDVANELRDRGALNEEEI